LGRVIHCFILIWLYLFWAQFFVIWFGNLPHEQEPLWRQMYGHYAPYYWTMMAGCFFVPFATLVFASIKGSLVSLCVIGFGINLGVWISKYLMIVPVFSTDDTPFDTWLDLSLSVGLLAGFLALLILLGRRLPLYSYWEMNLKPETRV
jgi:molybdopterin-containing oxidoreductase family membrane subunit